MDCANFGGAAGDAAASDEDFARDLNVVCGKSNVNMTLEGVGSV